jgi:organic hydroperoxide reductase OsmC/OhrA
LKFKAKVAWDGSEGGKSIAKNQVVYRFDTPKEFGGKAERTSPEEIFISSIGACLITTFLFFRKKIKFPMKSLRVDVNGKLDHKNSEGYRVREINASLIVEIENSQSIHKIQKCFDLTEKFCPISQSLKNCLTLKTSLKIEKS